jgi:hypothetical protein
MLDARTRQKQVDMRTSKVFIIQREEERKRRGRKEGRKEGKNHEHSAPLPRLRRSDRHRHLGLQRLPLPHLHFLPCAGPQNTNKKQSINAKRVESLTLLGQSVVLRRHLFPKDGTNQKTQKLLSQPLNLPFLIHILCSGNASILPSKPTLSSLYTLHLRGLDIRTAHSLSHIAAITRILLILTAGTGLPWTQHRVTHPLLHDAACPSHSSTNTGGAFSLPPKNKSSPNHLPRSDGLLHVASRLINSWPQCFFDSDAYYRQCPTYSIITPLLR